MPLTPPPVSARRTSFVARGREVCRADRALIMGIVNVTADSFYDGGRYLDPERAIAHAMELVDQGADLIDIGAESTRPGAIPVDEAEELRRVLPVVAGVSRRVPVPVSVDTTKARVAEQALDAGATIVNDVSALRVDPEMAEVVARSGAGLVLMHMQGTPQTMQHAPQYRDVVSEVAEFFDERMRIAVERGVAKSQIVLDPGIGFGKLLVHNLALINGLQVFAAFDRPLLVGPSRKAFIGHIIDRRVEAREWGTAAAVAIAVARGADIVRVHDVRMMADVVKVASALRDPEAFLQRESHA
jgi:dihydropteroate synthase